jgi:hypothetical protein
VLPVENFGMPTKEEFDDHFKKRVEGKTEHDKAYAEEMTRRDEAAKAFVKFASEAILPAFAEMKKALSGQGIKVEIVDNLKVPLMPSISVITSRVPIPAVKGMDIQNDWKKKQNVLFYAFEVDARGLRVEFRYAPNSKVVQAKPEIASLKKEGIESDIREFFMKAYSNEKR